MTRALNLSRWKHAIVPVALMATHALASAQTQPVNSLPPPQNLMSLSASATAEVTMDLMSVTFSTTKDGADAAAVQGQLKQALDAALAEARKVAKPGQVDVRTGNFSLMPRYAAKGGITGWQGSTQLQVEGRDMQAISQLAGRIQSMTIGNVRQGLSREAREKLEAETTGQAIARFRERALTQAQQFGFGSFTIREVQVGSDGSQVPSPVMMRAGAQAMSAEAVMPVEAGKTSVTSTVSGTVVMMK